MTGLGFFALWNLYRLARKLRQTSSISVALEHEQGYTATFWRIDHSLDNPFSR
jgi:hypothetical protein